MPLSKEKQDFYQEMYDYTKQMFNKTFDETIILESEGLDKIERGVYRLKYLYKNNLSIDFDCERNSFGIGFKNKKGESCGLKHEINFDDTLDKNNIGDAIIKLKRCLDDEKYYMYYSDYSKIYYKRQKDKIIYFNNQNDFLDDLINFNNFKS